MSFDVDPATSMVLDARPAMEADVVAGRFLFGETPEHPTRGQEAWGWCQGWAQLLYALICREHAARVRLLITFERDDDDDEEV